MWSANDQAVTLSVGRSSPISSQGTVSDQPASDVAADDLVVARKGAGGPPWCAYPLL